MEVPEELRVAIELADRTAKSKGRLAVFAKEMARVLRRLETTLTAGTKATPLAANAGQKAVYVVDSLSETLVEHRTSGRSNPFRCPKPLYDAVVTVLASADRAQGVEEITAQVTQLLSEPPAQHQLRVPLRLFMTIEPPLLVRSRARYRPVDAASFSSITSKLWEGLRK